MDRNRYLRSFATTVCFISLCIGLLPASARAQSDPPPPPPAPTSYHDSFEQGYFFFDDGVGVLHIRQSGSTAETDYAPGISASDGSFYARLLVQPWLQNNVGPGGQASLCPNNGSNCGINGNQSGRCNPGALAADNGFSCGGPFTEWGLPFGGYHGNFDSGIPIKKGALTSIDVYLDTAFAANARASVGTSDYRFDWDSDLLDSQGSFLQDYIFNVATGQQSDLACSAFISGGFYVIEASTNSQRSGANAHNPTPPNPPQACISQSGWYTFQHTFRPDHNNNLEVDMVILDSQHHFVAGWTLHPSCMGTQVSENLCTAGQPLPFSAVGYNFLGWLPDQEINDLAIDNFLRRPNDHDNGEGRDKDNDQMQFDDSPSNPQNSQMQYQDPSQGISLQSVNGVNSITYSNTCVSFGGAALVNGNPGYLYTFTACDLQLLGAGIGTFTINVTGPLGFLYQKSEALTSGYVSVNPQ